MSSHKLTIIAPFSLIPIEIHLPSSSSERHEMVDCDEMVDDDMVDDETDIFDKQLRKDDE